MKYRNFDQELFKYKTSENGIERFRVRVADSPAGQERLAEAESVSLPADLRSRLRQLDKRQLPLDGMIELGEVLAAALFPPRVRLFLERSRVRLDDDEGLRIRLRFDTYALADLPWEYSYLPRPDTPADQKGADGFLALDRGISLVRYEVLGQPPGSLDPVGTAPLRMVVLLANPQTPGYSKLDLNTEQKYIADAVKELTSIRPEFYPEATIDSLQDALVREAHVFHFAGHGKFEGDLGAAYGSIEGKGYLLLTGETGGAARLRADKLALNLKGRGVRLAVLGACEGGRRDQVNAWTGIVPSLTKAGIPAVVGMQFTILDANAIAFSKRLYRALAAGQPIDAAMTDGRLAIFNRGDDNERDWGVPVLYLRAEEGVLFPQVAGASPPAGGTGNGGSTAVGAGNGGASPSTQIRPPQRLTPAPDAASVDQRLLREVMVRTFGTDDLVLLCHDIQQSLNQDGIQLQVNLEIVGGSSKPAQVLNLIQYLDRRGYLGYLVAAVRGERPGLI